MSEFDAIFVGAGHNSLACAAHLASKGWKTAVFERNPVSGGAVQTRELTLPGFRHDLAAMNLSLFAGSAFHRKYANELKWAGLEFVPAADCFASVFPDGRWFGVSTDIEKTVARLEKFSKDDAETWRRLVGGFMGEAEHLFRLLGSPMGARALAGTGWNLWRKKGVKGSLDTAKLLLSSPRAWLDDNFTSPHVKATLAAWGMHLDFAPDIAGGAVFPYLESMANQSFGMVIGKGGADTIIRALEGVLTKAGGKVFHSADVAEIVTVSGKATGIRLANGETHTATKAVIAGVAPGALAGKLLPKGSGDAGFDTVMKKFRHAPGTMMIHLAMDGLPDWKAGEELKSFAYVHIAPSLEQMAKTYQQAIAGMLPDEPVLVVGQPTAVDPSRAPDGKHVLWVQVRALPAEVIGDAAGEIGPAHWDEIKERYADRALALIEKHAPGLSSKILGRAVFSPIDLERENPNLVGGDQICGSHHISQNFLFRPAPGYARWNTPVANLHLVGAATWPGAGTGAGSGFMLAQQLAGA
ncbi:NAD(P)/FAD-dependent oxidoreductase [Mesorhizobium sp. VNQ89]|uniref:phytoene desaturase family protein n=1 Tax=Mesorhizobium quangtriensis TaxID=3157709 RepID=UPI0032B7D6EF